MNASAFVQRNAPAGVKPRVTGRRALEQMQIVGAVAGLVGGAGVAMFGAAFTAASWFVTNESARQWLSNTGTALLFLTIPLLILGGYCMDWMARRPRPCKGIRKVRGQPRLRDQLYDRTRRRSASSGGSARKAVGNDECS
jgi:hypothetical protein